MAPRNKSKRQQKQKKCRVPSKEVDVEDNTKQTTHAVNNTTTYQQSSGEHSEWFDVTHGLPQTEAPSWRPQQFLVRVPSTRKVN